MERENLPKLQKDKTKLIIILEKYTEDGNRETNKHCCKRNRT